MLDLATRCKGWDPDEAYCLIAATVLGYGNGTQKDTHLDWARMKKGYQKLEERKLVSHNLTTRMVVGAALLVDNKACAYYYDRQTSGYSLAISSETYMDSIAKWLGKPHSTPK